MKKMLLALRIKIIYQTILHHDQKKKKSNNSTLVKQTQTNQFRY